MNKECSGARTNDKQCYFSLYGAGLSEQLAAPLDVCPQLRAQRGAVRGTRWPCLQAQVASASWTFWVIGWKFLNCV